VGIGESKLNQIPGWQREGKIDAYDEVGISLGFLNKCVRNLLTASAALKTQETSVAGFREPYLAF
jgi:hypothetical protein